MFRTSKGRHRAPVAPSHTGRVVAASVAAVGLSFLTAGNAFAATTTADLDTIAACESGGNPQASNGSHFGLFQFDSGTWRSVGGAGDPRNASVAEQYRRAQMLMASRGTQPWDASRGCWAKGTKKLVLPGPVKVKVKVEKSAPKHAAPPKAAPRHAAPVATVPSGNYTVLAGDTLSRIATQHGDGSWQKLFAENTDRVDDPNMIFPGQKLKV